MSKVFKAVATVAGVAALALAFVPGGQLIAGVAAAKLGAVAGAVSAVSGTFAQVTAKPPKTRGQVAQITIGANQPIPYMMGRSYSGGALVHDVGYGGSENPYRAITVVYSGAGPISSLVAVQADFSTIGLSGTAATGYYSGFLWADYLDGAGPAPRALVAQFVGEPGWSEAHKLSGFFCVKYTLKFDKKGNIFQSAVPQLGVIADGVRAYDPRLDSTRPGGSGGQRIDNEATWAFTKNPALHALTYAYGRYQNGKKVFGVDLGDLAIDIARVTAWANVCDANGWEVNGTIFEPDDKWNNLKLICEAGSGVPVPGSRLRFNYDAPGVSVDNITIHDLADGEVSLPVTQAFARRLNTVQGVYTSPDHRWEPMPTDKIVDTGLLASDGEEKAGQFGFKLVTNKNQAAQLAAYKMVNSREKAPIVIPVKARLLTYPVGTFLTAQLPAIGLASQKVKIVGKRRTMEDGGGEITVVTETDAKHAFALAATSGSPPVSALVPPAQLDALFASNIVADDPSVLTINEKLGLIPSEASRAGRTAELRSRMVALGLSVTALNAAEASWLTYRDSVSPSWSNAGQHSTINRTTWNNLSVAFDAALNAGDKAVSEQDASRANMITSNVVVNSEFTRGAYGFRFAANTSAGPTLTVNGGVNINADYSGIKNVMWANVVTGSPAWDSAGEADPFSTNGNWNSGNITEQRQFGLPVKQGDNVYARCLLARHRCIAVFWLLIFDKNGQLVEAPAWTGGRINGGLQGNPANFDVVGGTHLVSHANAATAMLMWRMRSTGETDPYIFMAEPAMGVLPSYQTTLPPYQLGNSDPLATEGAVIGVNTRDTSGNLLGGNDLRNNQIRIENGQFINPVGAGNGTTVDNSRVLVGARNLMINSGQFTNLNDWGSNGGLVTLDASVLYGIHNTLRITGLGGAVKNTVMRLKPNTQYTVSAMVRGSSDLSGGADETLHIQSWTAENSSNLHQETIVSADRAVTTSWKLISYTFITPNSATMTYCRFYFYPLAVGFTLNVGYVKLEEGNKATDWIQAPEEVTSGISDAATKALWSNVQQTPNAPENNADVTLTAQVTTQPPDDVTINADYLGAIIGGQFNKVTTPIVTRGGVSVRTVNRSTYTATNVTGGLVGNITMNDTAGSADKGRATITACPSTGSYQHNIFWDGVLIASYVVKFTVVPATAPIGGGGSGGTGNKSGSFDASGATFASTSFAEIGRISNLTKSAGETIRCYFPAATYQVSANSNVSRKALAKWQYSPAGANSWTDLSTAVVGTDSYWYATDFSGDEGSITVNQNAAPTDGSYDLRLVAGMNFDGGGASIQFTAGSASIVIGP